ncbi:MAG: uracil-DNA glycosylase [Candidatus Aminicenantes bacterium]|nr:uracil-DNA glycosylase [Candidatus Aminicenantes bacterium]
MNTVETFIEILKFYKEMGAEFLELKQDDPGLLLNQIHNEIKQCTKCDLHKTKSNYVPGEGSLRPDVFFIGEGPGETEDRFGRPFIGKAGQLLDKIILKMGYTRESVFIGNIIKCRPPNNRTPLKDEVEACIPYLKSQIEVLKPKVLVCLGKVAFDNLMGQSHPISKVRGQRFDYQNIPVIPTFHPSYILHQRSKQEISGAKWKVWEDMQKVLEIIR